MNDIPAETVYLIDDDESVRRGLERLLKSAGYRVKSFSSAGDYLGIKPTRRVACLILDLLMPQQTGMELQEELRARGDEIPIVFLTGHGSVPASVQAMKKGTVDFLTKPVEDVALLEAVRIGLERHRAICEHRERVDRIRKCVRLLTEREREVMRCVLSGALNKQIAVHLGIAEKTVKVHRGRVMQKMGVVSVADLVRACEAVGIMPQVVQS